MSTVTERKVKLLPQYQDVEVIKPGARVGKGGNPHHYLIDGVKYARVTSALGIINKPALIPWAKKLALGKVRDVLLDPEVLRGLATAGTEWSELPMDGTSQYEHFVDLVIDTASKRPDEVKEAAAERGTGFHQEIDQIMAGNTLEGISNVALHATEFLTDWAITVACSEMTVWNNTLQVAGTFDGAGWNKDGDLVIWDWKTGSGPWWEMALQLGAYAGMLDGLTGQWPASAYVVKLTEASYSVHRVTDLRAAWFAYERTVALQRDSKIVWWE